MISKHTYGPETLTRRGPVTTIEKPDGTYTLIYGIHAHAIAPRMLPDTLDGVLWETGEGGWVKDPLWIIDHLKNAKIFPRQYRRIIPALEERRIPLYFVDPRWIHTRRRFLIDVAIMALEGYIGEKVLKTMSQPTTAIDTTIEGVKATTAAWLFSPAASLIGRAASAFTGIGHGATAALAKTSERLHPEALVHIAQIRNLIVAHKAEWLMGHMGDHPHLAILFGAMHVGMESSILNQTPQERLQDLEWYRPLLKGMSIPTVSQIKRCDFDGVKWQHTETFEVPELKELVQK